MNSLLVQLWLRRLAVNPLIVFSRPQRSLLTSLCSLFQPSLSHLGGLLHHKLH